MVVYFFFLVRKGASYLIFPEAVAGFIAKFLVESQQFRKPNVVAFWINQRLRLVFLETQNRSITKQLLFHSGTPAKSEQYSQMVKKACEEFTKLSLSPADFRRMFATIVLDPASDIRKGWKDGTTETMKREFAIFQNTSVDMFDQYYCK